MSDWVGLLIGSIGTLLTLGISWGFVRAKLIELERALVNLEDALEKDEQRLHDTRERYVTLNHFQQVIMELKDCQKETRDDIKKILAALSKLTHD